MDDDEAPVFNIPKHVKANQLTNVSKKARTGASPETKYYTPHTLYSNLLKVVERKCRQGIGIKIPNLLEIFRLRRYIPESR